jgi:hypothetical protein
MANNNNPIEGQPELENASKGGTEASEKPAAQGQEQPERQPEAKSDAQPKGKSVAQPEAKNDAQPDAKSVAQPKAKSEAQPNAKSEGQAAPKEEEVPTGKGPKPIGPNQQTWENPKPGEELKKEIDEQLTKLKKLGENPSGQDPAIDELNKKQDIESRNEGPAQEKKSENNTQDNFDPAKHETEAPTH